MNLFKRLFVSVNSTVSNMVDQLENHEAIANSMIEEVAEAVAKVKVQYGQMCRKCKSLENHLEKVEKDITLWKERIRKIQTTDKEKALRCTKKLKELLEEKAQVEKELDQKNAMKTQIGNDLKRIEQKYKELQSKKEVMVSRQACAEVSKTVADSDTSMSKDIDQLFNRWDVKVTKHELIGGDCVHEVDELAEEFRSEEEDIELQELLHNVVNEERKN